MPIQLLYDGDCPLCLREVNFLRRRNRDRDLVAFINIADPNYNGPVDYARAMERIHAIMPDGRIISGVAVFREIYSALDLGWVYAITRLPGLNWLAEQIYGLWADYRLKLTGRPDLATLIAERQCSEGTCSRAINDPAQVGRDIERA